MSEENQENSKEQIDNQVLKAEIKEEQPEIKTEENQANWKKFREEREKERKAKAEAEERARQKAEEAEALKQALQALTEQKQYPQSGEEYNPYSSQLSQEEKIRQEIRKALEEEDAKRRNQQEEYERLNFPNRLNQNYRDFTQVCNSENLDYFDYHYPEISKSFSQMPESYEKWECIYKAVKRLVPFGDKSTHEKAIEKNLQKPQAATPQMTNQDGSSNPWKMTEERKRANWARMQADMKGAS